MQLTWTVNTTGPKKSITFNLQGLDSYTDKQIATAVGTELLHFRLNCLYCLKKLYWHTSIILIPLCKAHFDDMFENGREIIVRIKKFDSWDGDLEKDYGGKELGDVIEDWMKANTVKNVLVLPMQPKA